MEITVEDINPTRKKVIVTVSPEEIQKEEDGILGEAVRKVKFPGFRPGKVPASILRRRLGKEIQEELKNKLNAKAYEEFTEKSDLTILSVVKLEHESIELEAKEPGRLMFTLDVCADFDLPEKLPIEIKEPLVEVSQAEIEEVIKGMLEHQANYKLVDRPAQVGDFVKLSYEGRIGETLVSEILPDKPIYGTQQVTWEQVGEKKGLGVPAIIEGLEGLNIGEKKEIEQLYKEDFKVRELAGKTVLYSIEVIEIREKILPPLDEAMFKSLNVADEKALHERIRGEIAAKKEHRNFQMMRVEFTDKLLDIFEFPLPQSIVEKETESHLLHIMEQRIRQGTPQAQLEVEKETLFTQAQESASRELKLRFILERIAKREKISLEQKELVSYLLRQAKYENKNPEVLVKEMEGNNNQKRLFYQTALLEKTLDFLVKQAKVGEKEVEAEENKETE